VTDNVYCLVKIIETDERNIAAVQFEIKLFNFVSTSLNSSLIIFIWTYTVNYRKALDRLRVRMNIILLSIAISSIASIKSVRLPLQSTGSSSRQRGVANNVSALQLQQIM